MVAAAVEVVAAGEAGAKCELLVISLQEMIYIGNALFVGGNDYPVKEVGVVSIAVRDPRETKRVTEAIIACLADRGQKA